MYKQSRYTIEWGDVYIKHNFGGKEKKNKHKTMQVTVRCQEKHSILCQMFVNTKRKVYLSRFVTMEIAA